MDFAKIPKGNLASLATLHSKYLFLCIFNQSELIENGEDPGCVFWHGEHLFGELLSNVIVTLQGQEVETVIARFNRIDTSCA